MYIYMWECVFVFGKIFFFLMLDLLQQLHMPAIFFIVLTMFL